ncbi:MAG: MFS transporter [Cardiobacteriaceae bacterium]|nr:MFS transporter [Cardiobacteriaceae bacterium]
MSQTLQDLLNHSPMTRSRFLLFISCFLIAFFDGLDTALMGFIAPYLSADWGIEKGALAPVLTAALVGIMLGALIGGPLADKFGRRKVLLGSMILFSLLTMTSKFANSLDTLEILRFFTGLGLGSAMPNAVSLLTECSPSDRRPLLVNAMYCGFPLGIAVGGFVAAWFLPHFGWQSAFWWAGLLPLGLAAALVFSLPESPLYLAQMGKVEKLQQVLQKLLPKALWNTPYQLPEKETKQSALRYIISPKERRATLALWSAYFLGLCLFYSIINWLPSLSTAAQLSPEQGSRISGLFALGGLGAIVAGQLMRHIEGHGLTIGLTLITASALGFAGLDVMQTDYLVWGLLVAGVTHNTVQILLIALAAEHYPTHARTTGVAYMLGIGRLGAIVGTYGAGQLLRVGMGLGQMFAVLALCAAGIAALVWVKKYPS